MLVQIGIQILLPTILILIFLRAQYKSKLKWFTDALVFFLIIYFVFISARWDITSYYYRILLFPIFAIAGYAAFRRISPDQSTSSLAIRIKENSLNIILIGVIGWLNISVLSGRFYPGEAVDLEYPLRNGVHYVGGGGNNRWINNHNASPPQDYALDILRLNLFGRPGNILNQKDLDGYAIYGNPVYSPCSGVIVAVVDGLPDQIPPNRDTTNVAGNYVLILCGDVEILIAHMKQGSITVATGNDVHAGDNIGAVGNSGNTSQPHLHIHAEQGGKEGEILNGNGVPITFRNRFLLRNNLFTARKRVSE